MCVVVAHSCYHPHLKRVIDNLMKFEEIFSALISTAKTPEVSLLPRQISDEFRIILSVLVWNLSVICLESVLCHPIYIRKNILGPKSIRTCPKAARNIEPGINFGQVESEIRLNSIRQKNGIRSQSAPVWNPSGA